MNSLVNKEQKLYDNIQQNSHSTPTFLTAFADYLGFLTTDGFELLIHLEPAVSDRQQGLKELTQAYDEIVTHAGIALEQLIAIVDKHKIHNPLFDDRISCLRTFSSHNHHGSFDDPIGSNDLELIDAVRELQRLEYTDEALSFLNDSYNQEKGVRSENLIAFEKKALYLERHRLFHGEDTLSVTGAIMRVVKLYHQMQKVVDEESITLDEFVSALQDPLARVAYQNKLNQATLSTIGVHPREGISQDISRLHDSIHFNVTDAQQAKLFEVKQNHLYFKSGKLLYDSKPNGDEYGYVQLFKNVINYMPTGVIELNINEFIKLIPDGVENDPEKYRTQLTGEKSGLINLFGKNNIKNIHPNDHQSIFTITRASIRFNNLYSLE